MPRCSWVVLIGFMLLAGAAFAADHDKIAVKAGRIIPVAGEEIKDGIILIEHGKIKAVGKDLEIPYDYWVIEAKDRVVFPGMVEAFTSRGLDRPNESLPVTPFLDVYDAIDPSSVYFEDALRDGTTTLLISQGAGTVIGGIARTVKPIGMTVDEMTVQPDAGIILSFAPKSGHDRMVQMAYFRETFRELDQYLKDLGETKYEEKLKDEDKKIDVGPDEASERGRDLVKTEHLDFKHLNLYRLIRGELRAYLYCKSPLDVVHAVDTAKEHGFLERSVLVLEPGCYKAVDAVKGAGRPVILTANPIYLKVDPLTGDEEEIFVPAVYHEAGVSFSILSNPRTVLGERYLWYQAARMVRNGIPREVALQAITITPATAIGLGSRVGSILAGRDANLLLLTGDPLEAETWVDQVIIEGKLVYERDKDYRLKELLTGREISAEEVVEEEDGSQSEDEE